MSDERLQARQSTIDELTSFIDNSHHQLDELFDQLQWNKEEILTQTEKKMKLCPTNSHHFVPEMSMERHIHECELVAKGYPRHEQKEIQSSHSFFYTNSSAVVPVMIDKEAQQEILSRVPGCSLDRDVPRTVDRMDKAFTSAEKLAIHLAVLEKSKADNKQAAISLQELEFNPDALLKKGDTNKPKSRLEILAELRDYKRRRQSYRAKNVHITRKSQTEIMRDVIEAQMSEIQQAFQGEEGSVTGSEHRGRSSSPGRTRSRDVSRSPVRSRSRRDDDRRNESWGHRTSNRSSYGEERDYPIRREDPRSRDSSRSPASRQDNNRHRDTEVAENPPIKIEKVERIRSCESSRSPGRSESSRPSSPRTRVLDIKVEKESPLSRSPSQGRGDEREDEGRRHHHHSKHKHRHKHRHHSRDSR